MRVRVEPDVELEYEVAGDGPELVWLHGLSGSLEDARPVAERLAERFRVLWYSCRGHGRSSSLRDAARYGYGRIAADLDALLDHTGFDRPLLAGGSHGANTILRHEADFPGRARGLLLVAPGGNAISRARWHHFALLRFQLWRACRGDDDRLIAFCVGAPPGHPDADPLAVAAMRTHDPATLRVALRHIPDQRAADPAALARFDVSTHVAAWDGDPVVHPIAVARRIASLVPGATFAEIPRAAGLSAAQVADLAHDVVGTWADGVLRTSG